MKFSPDSAKKTIKNGILTVGLTLGLATISNAQENKGAVKDTEKPVVETAVQTNIEKDNQLILSKIVAIEVGAQKQAQKVVEDGKTTYAFMRESEVTRQADYQTSAIEEIATFNAASIYINSEENGKSFNVAARSVGDMNVLQQESEIMNEFGFKNPNNVLKKMSAVDTYVVVGIHGSNLVIRLINPTTKEMTVHEYDLELNPNRTLEQQADKIAEVTQEKVQELLK